MAWYELNARRMTRAHKIRSNKFHIELILKLNKHYQSTKMKMNISGLATDARTDYVYKNEGDFFMCKLKWYWKHECLNFNGNDAGWEYEHYIARSFCLWYCRFFFLSVTSINAFGINLKFMCTVWILKCGPICMMFVANFYTFAINILFQSIMKNEYEFVCINSVNMLVVYHFRRRWHFLLTLYYLVRIHKQENYYTKTWHQWYDKQRYNWWTIFEWKPNYIHIMRVFPKIIAIITFLFYNFCCFFPLFSEWKCSDICMLKVLCQLRMLLCQCLAFA